MAVDFSRALKVKSPSKGIVTYYGLTSAPTSGHYIAFRSQGAVRYIKLQVGNGQALRVRIADNNYYPYNNMEFRVHFSNTKSSLGWFPVYKSQLTKIEYLYGIGGASLPASVTIAFYNGDTHLGTDTTVTLNANTESQTYSNELYSGVLVPDTIKITLTINGKSVTATANYVQSGTQSIYTYKTVAPW